MSRSFRSKKYWWLNCREKIFFLFFLAICFIITPKKVGQGVVAAFPEFQGIVEASIPLPTPAPYPINTTGKLPADTISAYSVYVVDAESGVPLYAKNESEALPPASTTKLMTALVALNLYSLEDVITVKPSSASGQLMNLVVGERMTVENLLYGMLIYSGNDAAEQIAMAHPQGYQAFITAMNAKAHELHLEHSVFTNSAGYDDPIHKMSAKDLVRLSRVAIEDPLIAKIVAIPQITISDADHTIYHSLKSTNTLLGKIPGVSGIKTGFTQEAGENLVTLVERNGRRIIFVVLRSKDRFADTTVLIDWAFANHQWVNYGV
jgi:serine-type D-Ala-D-Ala carboxypeptidase (penicillin-binding protein 5/6)